LLCSCHRRRPPEKVTNRYESAAMKRDPSFARNKYLCSKAYANAYSPSHEATVRAAERKLRLLRLRYSPNSYRLYRTRKRQLLTRQ
jgi:hypothetical protein